MMNSLSFGRLTHTASASVLNHTITVRRGHFTGRSPLGAARHESPTGHRRRIARLSWFQDLGPSRRSGATSFAARGDKCSDGGSSSGGVVVRHRRYMTRRGCLSRHDWKVPGLLYVSESYASAIEPQHSCRSRLCAKLRPIVECQRAVYPHAERVEARAVSRDRFASEGGSERASESREGNTVLSRKGRTTWESEGSRYC